jgi:hypothetical protein
MAGSMMGQRAIRVFNAVFYPSRFVQANIIEQTGSRLQKLYTANRLLIVFFVNLVLYAVPLTLAGFGEVPTGSSAPTVIAAVSDLLSINAVDLWEFTRRFLQNCFYITLATGLTFVAFHASVIITLQSSGVLPTLHTVVYSTSAYLAGAFSVVWYLSTSSSIVAADALLLSVQKRFIYFFIDWMGVDLTLPSGRPQPVELDDLTVQGELAIALLLALSLYFVYSLYLGSRLNHGASRLSSALTIVTVSFMPAVFVLGSILFTLLEITIPI